MATPSQIPLDPSHTPLAPTELLDGMRLTFADYLVMQTTASNVLNQATLHLPGVPTLADNQVAIKVDVNLYQDKFLPYQQEVFNLVTGFKNALQGCYAALLGAANAWDEGKGGDTFKQGLAILKATSDAYRDQVQGYVNELSTYIDLAITKDIKIYQNDLLEATKRYTGPDGEIGRLRSNLAALSKQMDEANRAIAVDAGLQMLKISEIAIDVGMAAAEVPGLASVVVDTVFSYADHSTGDKADMLEKSKGYIAEYEQNLESLLKVQIELALLSTLSLNLERFHNGVILMQKTMSAVQGSWNEVSRSLDALGAYNTAPSKRFFEDTVTQAGESWAALGQKAQDFVNAIETIDWTDPHALP